MTPRARSILWLDGGAGALVGLLSWALRDWLVGFYGLPLPLITLIATANIGYASYSLCLAALSSQRRSLPRRAIDVLVIANAVWALVCVSLLAANVRQAGVLGLVHIAVEGAFVALLAVVEYRQVRPEAR